MTCSFKREESEDQDYKWKKKKDCKWDEPVYEMF